MACGNPVPHPGIKSTPPHIGSVVLTTGPPGKPHLVQFNQDVSLLGKLQSPFLYMSLKLFLPKSLKFELFPQPSHLDWPCDLLWPTKQR